MQRLEPSKKIATRKMVTLTEKQAKAIEKFSNKKNISHSEGIRRLIDIGLQNK